MTGFFIFSVAFVFGGIRVDAPILVKVDFKMFFFAAAILSVPTGAMRMVVLSMLMVMMAVERLGPSITAQAGMVGPMSTLLLAVWWLDEPFNAWILAGTALVLLGVFWVSRMKGT